MTLGFESEVFDSTGMVFLKHVLNIAEVNEMGLSLFSFNKKSMQFKENFTRFRTNRGNEYILTSARVLILSFRIYFTTINVASAYR